MALNYYWPVLCLKINALALILLNLQQKRRHFCCSFVGKSNSKRDFDKSSNVVLSSILLKVYPSKVLVTPIRTQLDIFALIILMRITETICIIFKTMERSQKNYLLNFHKLLLVLNLHLIVDDFLAFC